MTAIAKHKIHAEILAAIGDAADAHGPLEEVPFKLRLVNLGSFAFYAFTLSSPPGGRPVGEYKIQLIAPGHERGERGQLHFPTGAFTILIGWSRKEDVFVLWDAYAHGSFAYSKNVQVKGECVWLAQVGDISTTKRRLRGGEGSEVIVACRSDRLLEGIETRVQMSASRLSGMRSDL